MDSRIVPDDPLDRGFVSVVDNGPTQSSDTQARYWRSRLAEVKADLFEAALSSPTAETGGLVLDDFTTISDNLALNPIKELVLDDENAQLIESLTGKGERCIFWHSHVLSIYPGLSPEDIKLARDTGFPVWVYNLATGAQDYYDPLEPLPLEGRPWHWAYSHCWDLIRDYYWQVRGIKLRAHYMISPTEVTSPGFTRYLSGLPAEGFVSVNKETWLAGDRKEHDLLLFQWATQQPSHIAIYLADGEILHQPADLPSKKSKLMQGYINMLNSVWRYAGTT